MKITQKRVLKVLVENEDKWFDVNELARLSGVARNHVASAGKFFLDNDYVYMPNNEGKITVSPNGIAAYYSEENE